MKKKKGETSCGCLGCAGTIIGIVLLYWLFFEGGIGQILNHLKAW